MTKVLIAASIAACLALLGCGGDGTPEAAPQVPSSPAAPSAASASEYGPDELMDWAESKYPNFFPSAQTSQTFEQYLYRYYPETGNYLGVAGTTVSVLGPLSGGSILNVGTLEQFRCQVHPEACGAIELPRIVVGQGIAAARRSDGTWVAWGDDSVIQPHLVLIPGKGTQELASSARQIVLESQIGVIVDSTGRASGWGRFGQSVGAALNLSVKFADRVPMDFPGEVIQAGTAVSATAWRSIALLKDGSLWSFPGSGADIFNRKPQQIPAPENLRFFSTHSMVTLGTASIVHGITQDGTVWRIALGSAEPPRPISGATQVVWVHCTYLTGNRCVGVRRDGTAIAWAVSGTTQPLGDAVLRLDEPIAIPNLPAVKHAYYAGRAYFLAVNGTLWKWDESSSSIKDAEREGNVTDGTDLGCGQSACFLRRSNGALVTVSSTSSGPSVTPPTVP